MYVDAKDWCKQEHQKRLVTFQEQKQKWIGSGIGTPGLSTPMKRYTNRPAHLQPTTDEDLVKHSKSPQHRKLTNSQRGFY